jgi:hypothetical protein
VAGEQVVGRDEEDDGDDDDDAPKQRGEKVKSLLSIRNLPEKGREDKKGRRKIQMRKKNPRKGISGEGIKKARDRLIMLQIIHLTRSGGRATRDNMMNMVVVRVIMHHRRR